MNLHNSTWYKAVKQRITNGSWSDDMHGYFTNNQPTTNHWILINTKNNKQINII